MRSLNNPIIWYLMRGSGVVTLILFTVVVVLGIATTRRFGKLRTSTGWSLAWWN